MFDVLLYFVDSGQIKSKTFSINENCTIKDFTLSNNLSSILPDFIIKKNDRLELYEPTTIDPKTRRKNIATNR